MSATRRANPRWLLAERDGGLVLVGAGASIDVAVAGPAYEARALCELLVAGADAPSVAAALGCEIAEAAALLDDLTARGALVAECAPVPDAGCPLGTALRSAEPPALCWTAEEALLLPARAPAALRREALERFACGLADHTRLLAYAHELRAARATTWGDAPDPAALARALARARASDPDEVHVHVLDLVAGAAGRAPSDARVAASELGGLTAGAAHRLGPILATAVHGEQDGRTIATAYRAVPSLRACAHADARHSRGSAATPELAELVARAEATERYALEDPDSLPLVRARASELEGAIAPAALLAHSARQRADRGSPEPQDDPELTWAPLRTAGGEPRWAPAGAVLLTLDEPGGVVLSGSGAAAHTDLARARERALAELIERDAFMRTWVQRVSRELIDRGSLPAALAGWLRALEARGVRAALVNLSLESWPVVLCVLHGESRLALGAACRPRAEEAATAAVAEAAGVLRLAPHQDPAPIAPEAVRTPLEHFRLHQDAERIAADSFLWSSPDAVALAEIPAPAAPGAELLAQVGEVCFAELSGRRLRPFVVARALVPGLVPITFGHDQEPLGLPRLGEPLRPLDGRRLAGFRSPDDGVMIPHPFP